MFDLYSMLNMSMLTVGLLYAAYSSFILGALFVFKRYFLTFLVFVFIIVPMVYFPFLLDEGSLEKIINEDHFLQKTGHLASFSNKQKAVLYGCLADADFRVFFVDAMKRKAGSDNIPSGIVDKSFHVEIKPMDGFPTRRSVFVKCKIEMDEKIF